MPGDATPRGPLGDARPDAQERPVAPTPGSLKPEKVEDRDNVGTVAVKLRSPPTAVRRRAPTRR